MLGDSKSKSSRNCFKLLLDQTHDPLFIKKAPTNSNYFLIHFFSFLQDLTQFCVLFFFFYKYNNKNMDRKRGCMIRKRGCSSSSSSSLARRNRFKRAIFAGKRASLEDGGGSGTPVKSISAAKTPVLLPFSPENPPVCQSQKRCVSARKLAATLWEISDGNTEPPVSNEDCLRNKKPPRNRRKTSTEIPFPDFPLKSSHPVSHEVRVCLCLKFPLFF